MSKTSAQPDLAGRPRRRLRRRRVPLPLPPRHPVRSRRRLQLRGDGRPVQQRPGQQPRQPAARGSPPSSARSATASVPRRSPTARSRRSPPSAYADAGGGVGRRAAVGRPRGHLAADPRDQRPPRGQRAVEGRARPRGRRRARRRARGAADRRGPGHAGDSSARPRRSGAASGSTASPADQRLPEAAAWGGIPAGCRSRRATPLFPRITG